MTLIKSGKSILDIWRKIMVIRRALFSLFILACLLALTACGSSDVPTLSSPTQNSPAGNNPSPTPDPAPAPSPTPGPTISGTATAPGGTIAQLENGRSFFYATLNTLITTVYADIIGLEPINNATVQLIRINDAGIQVGEVLASAITSSTGAYTLVLPSGLTLSADLIVRITGNNIEMRAMVVDQVVDINPISHFVQSKFIDSGLTLANLPINQVVTLQGKVKEFDITAAPGFDIAAVLAKLDADLGNLVENEIAVIQSQPAQSNVTATIAGTWNTVELMLGMHDSEDEASGSFNISLLSNKLQVAAGSADGDILISVGETLIESETRLTKFKLQPGGDLIPPQLYNIIDLNIPSEDESFPARLNANGNIIVQTPFEEELQALPEGFGLPQYGWRRPPQTIILDNINANTSIGAWLGAGVRYGTDQTGAIDPKNKLGDELESNLLIVLKEGVGLNESSLSGKYGFVNLQLELAISRGISLDIFSDVGLVDFNGGGSVTLAPNAIDSKSFSRVPSDTPPSLMTLTPTSLTEPDVPIFLDYQVSASGLVTIDTGDETVLQGWVNADGSVMALLGVNAETASVDTDTISAVEHQMLIGVKLPVSTLLLDGVYRLYPYLYAAEDTGLTEILSMARTSTMTISGESLNIDYSIRGYQRDTDIAAIEPVSENGSLTLTLQLGGTDGKVSAAAADDEITLTGFVSSDGRMMVLRLYADEGTSYQLIGVVVAVKQN